MVGIIALIDLRIRYAPSKKVSEIPIIERTRSMLAKGQAINLKSTLRAKAAPNTGRRMCCTKSLDFDLLIVYNTERRDAPPREIENRMPAPGQSINLKKNPINRITPIIKNKIFLSICNLNHLCVTKYRGLILPNV